MHSAHLLASYTYLQPPGSGAWLTSGCAVPAAVLHRPSEHRAAFLVYINLIAAARKRAVPSEFFQIGLKR
ncbi:hypothetical protein D3C72_219030 [compost metagenome]